MNMSLQKFLLRQIPICRIVGFTISFSIGIFAERMRKFRGNSYFEVLEVVVAVINSSIISFSLFNISRKKMVMILL